MPQKRIALNVNAEGVNVTTTKVSLRSGVAVNGALVEEEEFKGLAQETDSDGNAFVYDAAGDPPAPVQAKQDTDPATEPSQSAPQGAGGTVASRRQQTTQQQTDEQ